MTVAVRYTPPALIDAIGVMPYAACGPASNSPQTIVELRLLGGALAREPRHRSPFCHRNAAYALSVIGVLAPPAGDGSLGTQLRWWMN
jgi:hypothetical protein